MNAISKTSRRLEPLASLDLWSRYQALSPAAKLVMQLKSLLVPHLTKQDFHAGVSGGGFKLPDGKALSAHHLKDILAELQDKQLLDSSQHCVTPLLHNIAVDAMSSSHSAALIVSIQKGFPASGVGRGYYSGVVIEQNASRRLLRVAIYSNDPVASAASLAHFYNYFGALALDEALNELFGELQPPLEWIVARHPSIQIAFFTTKMSAFLTTGVAAPGLMDLIQIFRERQEDEIFAPSAWLLAYYDLMSGRLDALKRTLAVVKPTEEGVSERVFTAAVAFLEGRNDVALATYREALKRHRKGKGKRRVFLPGQHGMMFILSLLRANDPALQAEIQTGLEQALEDPGTRLGFIALRAMLLLVQGQQAVAVEVLSELRKTPPAEPLSAALLALSEYVVDPALARKQIKVLTETFSRVAESLPTVARIYAEILAQISKAPAPYEDYLANTATSITISFTQIIKSRPAWERALESLGVFLGGDAIAAVEKEKRKTKRLVWFVDPDQRYVEVAEQSAKGRDGWTDGRPVSLKRLHERDPKLDYLLEADRTALAAIRMEKSGWSSVDVSYYLDPSRALVLLVGHPHVFDARRRSQPIELVAYPLELVVTPAKGGYRVALSHSGTEATVFLEQETPTRYRVVEFPAKILAVQAIVGARGLIVPEAARDQLVGLVRRNHPALPVRDEIGAVADAAIEGVATPILQCTPYEAGLKLNLVVRPFGAEGPAYVAGLGGRSVLATIAGRPLRATRDLDAELAQRKALIESCPTLRDRVGSDTHELILEDLEGCLELLVELAALQEPATIEWPEGRKLRVSAVLPQNMKLRVARDRDWFSVEGSVALDRDQVLEMRYLLDRLDRAQGRFIPLDDGRFIALTRQLQSQLQAFAAVSEPHKDGRRVHALGAPALEGVLEQAGEVKTDAAWKRHVANIRNAEGWTPKLPTTLQAELRDYQVDGFVWISRLARWGAGACLADDMGLGKTVQTIAVMLDRAAEGPCLVVAPTSVCPNWEAEIARFAPTLTTHRLSRAADRAALIAQLGASDVLICSYGLLHQEAEALAAKPWHTAVLDEAQAIKNAQSRRSQASSSLQAGLRLALSGTPVENDLDELWSLFNFVNPGLLGSREGFQKRFAIPIERDRDVNARQALRALIRPFLLRRTKSAVLSELPPRTEQTMQIEMSEAERAFYEALRQKALENIEVMDAQKGKRKIQILAEIMKLRRACCNPSLIDAAAGVSSAKLSAFLELVDDLIRNRHRALVFSQFVGHLSLVREALEARKISYEYLDGSTPSADRERRVAAFQAGSADIFLISLRAGGTGLNLTAADYVVHLDPWWNPAVEDQASDRAHRMGQERPVTIYRLIMQDSIEERILRLHRDKRDLASDLLEGAETTARLSEEELLDLIRV
jgi:superfamily II DNA or RNA helicase